MAKDPEALTAKSPPRHRRAVARAQELSEAAQREVDRRREAVPAFDAGLAAVERNRAVAGGLLASALAYRLFVWLLPIALLASVALGFLRDGARSTRAADDLGVSGYVTSLVTDASAQAHQSRWWMLLVALIALYSAGKGGSRALVALHHLAWGEPIGPPPKAWAAVGGLLGFTVAGVGAASLARWTRRGPGEAELLGVIGTPVIFGALWLLASLALPHRSAPWRSLLPGAVLVGLGAQGMHLFTTYYLVGKLESSSELYGALGAAAAILLWLYAIGYLVVAVAVLNATIWSRTSGDVP